jgi:glyoxylase-like metal-dependent hydrolase (beta-lactamase superfamily II)
VALSFLNDFDPHRGECVQVAPGLRRVVADNPSKFTAWGTGTYLVGTGEVAVIDPGPALDAHVDAVLAAVDGETVTHLLITHTHADHSPAAAALSERTGALTYGFGPHPAAADTGSEEHGDLDFVPDVVVADGDVIRGNGFTFECLHTPGHISNHVCYAERTTGALFPGDHVMGWSTTVISPPDGRITDYLANLRRLLGRDDRVYYPTHGPPITDPHPYVAALVEHRLERERQIVDQLAAGPRTIPDIVDVLYADVRPELHEPAGRSVHAHLIALAEAGRVTGDGADDTFALAGAD